MNSHPRFWLGLVAILLVGIAPRACAQGSPCLYEYFDLRTRPDDRNYFSVVVTFQGSSRRAFGTFQDVETFYEQYPQSAYGYTFSAADMVSRLSRGFSLQSPVPFDSLTVLEFATPAELHRAKAIAAKGEAYFLAYYFNKWGALREDRQTRPPAVMKYLQRWCIAASQDDETGLLCIRYKFAPLKKRP